MLISVVIPTRNRADLLEGTLETLAAQVAGSEEWEVLVMDNGSTDNTPALCARMAGRFKAFQYRIVSEPGLHAGRNAGWQSARGEIIAFLDDDVRLPPHWLVGVRIAFSDPATMLAGGPVLPEFAAEPPDWLAQRWYSQPEGGRILGELSIIDLGQVRKVISSFQVFGCNFLVRRAVLESARGFHPDGMPAELLHLRGDGETYISRFVQQQSWQTFYEPLAGIRHLVTVDRMTMHYFTERQFRQGISDSYTHHRARQGGRVPRPLLRLLLGLIRQVPKGGLSMRMKLAYVRGFCWHWVKVRRTPGLKTWIQAEHYLAPQAR